MYCLNHRIGILFRENTTKKSYQLRYFFIDDSASMYYIVNLSKLQKIIRLSKDCKQIKTRLIRLGQKCFNLNNYNITQPKQYKTQSVLPFCNRTCIQIREKQVKQPNLKQSKDGKDVKTAYMLLGLLDDETNYIYEEILHLTGKRKKQVHKRKSVQQKAQEDQIQAESRAFSSYLQCSHDFSMSSQKNQKQIQNQYQGQQIQGVAKGRGKQILVSKGMTYNGQFSNGKKHGNGYLVNKNLDTLECQFINDELAGI